MKVILSPAKSLDFDRKLPTELNTKALFLAEAERLNLLLKKKSAKSLSKLMRISDNLGQLNFERNQEWSLPFSPKDSRPAAFAFSGDVYRGMDIYTLPESKIETLQNTVRIISGLYGVLKPLDLIQPYRLEMGTRMPVGKNKNLYEFWKPKIAKALNAELNDDELFVNLASNEYFKAIDKKELKTPIIDIVFKDLKNGEYKTIMTFVKLARGYMTRYILDVNAKTLDDLKGFDYKGYGFSETLSQKENELVFVR